MVFCSCGPHASTGAHCAHAASRPVAAARSRPRPRPLTPRSRRFSVPVPVSVRMVSRLGTQCDSSATLRNLSKTGALVHSGLLPRVDRHALLRFVCGGSLCVAGGIVVASRAERGFAIEIEGGNAAFETLFSELCAVREDVSRDVLRLVSAAELTVM